MKYALALFIIPFVLALAITAATLYPICNALHVHYYGLWCSSSIAEMTGVSEVHFDGKKALDQNGRALEVGPISTTTLPNGVVLETATVAVPIY